jgi:hypothetical protein
LILFLPTARQNSNLPTSSSNALSSMRSPRNSTSGHQQQLESC